MFFCFLPSSHNFSNPRFLYFSTFFTHLMRTRNGVLAKFRKFSSVSSLSLFKQFPQQNLTLGFGQHSYTSPYFHLHLFDLSFLSIVHYHRICFPVYTSILIIYTLCIIYESPYLYLHIRITLLGV